MVTPGKTFASRQIQAPSLISIGLCAYSSEALRKSWPPEQIMDLCEMQTFDPIVTFSWLINQTSSPIQQSSPISRFQGKWTLTPLRMITRRPIEDPKILKRGERRDDGKNDFWKTKYCTMNHKAIRIFIRSVKPVPTEKVFKSLFTFEFYFYT